MLEIRVGFQLIRLGRLHQRITGRTGSCAVRGICKQPGASTNGKGPDRILSQRIADVQLAVLTIANQIRPLVQRVRYRFVGQAIFGYPADVLLQPLLQVIKHWHAECLSRLFFLIVVQVLDRFLYRIQLADLTQRDVGLGWLTCFLWSTSGLGRPAGFNKLAPGMVVILSAR